MSAPFTTTPDQFRNRLTLLLVLAFIVIIPLFIFWGMPTTSKDIVTYMVGQLSGMVLMALGFYFSNKAGQDDLDHKRAETTGKLADAVVTATNATPGSNTAGRAAESVADAAVDRAHEISGDKPQ